MKDFIRLFDVDDDFFLHTCLFCYPVRVQKMCRTINNNSAMRFHPSLPRGFSKKQLRLARKRWGIHGKVDIHHVVPRQLKGHPHLRRFRYDVEDYNLMFCATRVGSQSLYLKPSRPIHDLHHNRYNLFVTQQLDAVTDFSSFLLVLSMLYRICRGRTPHTWK